MNAASRISEYLKNNGIKQSFLSEKSGISTSSLSSKLNGTTKISAEEIESICWALGCYPNEFLFPKPPEAKC